MLKCYTQQINNIDVKLYCYNVFSNMLKCIVNILTICNLNGHNGVN